MRDRVWNVGIAWRADMGTGNKIGRPRKYATAEEAKEANRQHNRQRYRSRPKAKAVKTKVTRMEPPAPTALQERERAMTAPRTLSQEIMGDPLKGRSALERMSP